ncbi:restriction endonuclease, partial [Tetragenococcus halophilus]
MQKNNLLITGDVYSNSQIIDIFKVSNSGGIRFSTKTRSLVIFSFHHNVSQKDVPYQDFWENSTLHYTGQGKEGNQELTRNNKKIVEAQQDGITIHLFESFVKGENIYRGIVYLSQKPYQINELDANHNYRLVYKFPLTIKNGNGELPLSIVQNFEIQQDKHLQKLPQSKLAEMAQEISRS